MSQAVNHPPKKDAITPSSINKIAVGTLDTNFAPPAQMMPKTSITIPQINAVNEYKGAKMNQKMPNMPAMPRKMRIKPPINAIIKPIVANARIMFSPPKQFDFWLSFSVGYKILLNK
jgi:hypothetical protein